MLNAARFLEAQFSCSRDVYNLKSLEISSTTFHVDSSNVLIVSPERSTLLSHADRVPGLTKGRTVMHVSNNKATPYLLFSGTTVSTPLHDIEIAI